MGDEAGIATLIAGGTLARGSISAAADALSQAGVRPGQPCWIDEGAACDLPFAGPLALARAALEPLTATFDIVVQPRDGRRKHLLVADMDSTMITVECIDELAEYAGVKNEVAAITERAMRGELDFAAALWARVALLGGLREEVIEACYRERVRPTAGARTLVATMRADGARAVLVSGGFTAFADRVAAEIGFDRAVANRLGTAGGVLTGDVMPPIVDGERKAETLREESGTLGLGRADTLAVGDGANDLAMIEAAGLGIALRAKPLLAQAADARIEHCDLTALLYAQGYSRAEWSEA